MSLAALPWNWPNHIQGRPRTCSTADATSSEYYGPARDQAAEDR